MGCDGRQTCARVFLSDDEIHAFCKKLRYKDAEGHQRKLVNKIARGCTAYRPSPAQITDKSKKVLVCERCRAVNGPVKKVNRHYYHKLAIILPGGATEAHPREVQAGLHEV